MVRLGEGNGASKLTAADVSEIRRRAVRESKRSIAALFGVSRAAIYHILNGRNWGYLR